MEFNRNPKNYFVEFERAAFQPSNVVPPPGRQRSVPGAARWRGAPHAAKRLKSQPLPGAAANSALV